MSADQDIGLDEKRVYDGDERESTVYVAAETGLVAVSVVADRVGEFSLVERCTARDVAAGPPGVVVATDDDVLLDAAGDDDSGGDERDGDGFEPVDFERLEFGAATAVSTHGDDVLAARPSGMVERYSDGSWRELGRVEVLNGLDGDLLATGRGVYRALEDSLRHVGLASAVDVSASGVPLAATDEALYQLGNGWVDVVEGAFRFVASDPDAEGGVLGRAHAGTGDHLYAHYDDAWEVELTVDRPIADVAYGDSVYAVSEDGLFAAESPDDWRHQELGVRGVAAAVARPE